MIVKLMNKECIEVDDTRGEAIKAAIRSGVEYIDIDDALIKTSTIMSVEKSPAYSHYNVQAGTYICGPTTELTDEQRLHNLDRIRRMKEQFIQKKSLT